MSLTRHTHSNQREIAMKYCEENHMTMFTDLEYIQLGIANAYGKDSVTWAERLDWFKNNEHQLMDLVDEAKEPYQYIKAIHAYEDSLEGRPTGYAIGMDSTASGVQMFALLSGCEKTATAVNLIGDGIRHDLYTAVLNELSMAMEREGIKKPVMTHFYQSTKLQEELFGEGYPEFIRAMEQGLPGAQEVLEICRIVQKHITKGEYRVKTPAGHDVYIRHRVKKDYKVECKIPVEGTKGMYFTQRKREFGIKRDRYGKPSGRDVSANLAHVCDGWFASQLITRAKKEWDIDIYHVHDKFFAHPRHMNRVRWLGREVLVELYEMDYLQYFVRELTGQKDYIYKKHSTDLAAKIRTSDYFIC